MVKNKTNRPSKGARLLTMVRVYISNHPIVTALVSIAAYFILLQLSFVTSGDIWAEGYMEYLHKAVTFHWDAVTAPSWEGYMTLLPSFFSKLYISMQMPLGFIDIWYRLIAVVFAAGSLAIIASPLTRTVWPRLWQRLVVIAFLLFTLWHVSAFSFINIWYVGFVPIAILCMSAVPMRVWQKVAYTIFGVVLALTKPSVILMPFLVYRAIKTKEYISNGLIFIAACYQTYLLFFATSNGERHVPSDVLGIIKTLYVGVGTEVLKLVHIAPNDVLVALATMLVVGIFALLVWRRGWLMAGLAAFGFSFAVYSYVLAPDPSANTFTLTSAQLFADHYKLQREILIMAFFIVAIGMLLPDAWAKLRSLRAKWRPYAYAGGALAIVIFGIMVYRPIDTTSGSVAIDITPFRPTLTLRQPACMPVAPLPSWSPGTAWFFAQNGGCVFQGPSRAPAETAFTRDTINAPLRVAGVEGHNLMTVMVPVNVAAPHTAKIVRLKEVESGMVFTGKIMATSQNGVQFVAFNVAGLPMRLEYSFIVAGEKGVRVAPLEGAESIVGYSYHMGEAY